jgi:DNA-binding GntR family transcriptional regulator
MPKPKYVQVADKIRDKIRNGEYRVNDPLPSTRELIAEHGVSYGTLREALRDLKAEGLIEGRQGDGVYVLPPRAG